LGLVSLILFISACSPKYWDVTGTISGPSIAQPGQQLGQNIVVTVVNTGSKAVDSLAIDLVLSSDEIIPVEYATPSDNFNEDMLLLGGREFIHSINPGESVNITLFGDNSIPADTPLGNYYLGVVVDSGQVIQERDETNNIALTPLQICAPVAEVNSISLLDASGGVVGFAHMRFSWLYSSGERPHIMMITVFRNENGAWKNVMPNQEPFNISDPTNTTQAEVAIFRLFNDQYKVVFAAEYTCDRQVEYIYEFVLSN